MTSAERTNARHEKIWNKFYQQRREKARVELLNTAKALLERIDNITTDEFSKGGERDEREALRRAIADTESATAA